MLSLVAKKNLQDKSNYIQLKQHFSCLGCQRYNWQAGNAEALGPIFYKSLRKPSLLIRHQLL